jgi:hypothetical protein
MELRPFENALLAVERPFGWSQCLKPVQRFADRNFLGGQVEAVANRLALLLSHGFRLRRNEKRYATSGYQLHPLLVEPPVHLCRQTHTIGIGRIELIVLGDSESQRIYTHLKRPRPLFPARVITDALHFKQSGTQM